MGTQAFERNRVARRRSILLAAAAIVLTAGCNRMEDTNANYTRAIDRYYGSHPSCLFSEPVKFPVQIDAAEAKQKAGYDALVSEALLTRSAETKQVLIVASKPVDNYDLSSKGHSIWVGDAQEPGYGNLCYGHRKVIAIDSSTPTTSTAGATTNVVYRYTVKDVPAWAKAAEVQAAFSGLRGDLTGRQVGRATLEDTKKGWEVTAAPWAHIDDSDIYR